MRKVKGIFLLQLAFISIAPSLVFGISTLQSAIPDQSLNPDDVVRIQLQSLKSNDPSNFGIEVTFRFASPNNKRNTGPLEKFIKLVNSPAYRPMLNHLDAQLLKLKIHLDQAIQDVIITTNEAKRIGYRFILSRQSGSEYQGCWMTDAVIRFEVPDLSV